MIERIQHIEAFNRYYALGPQRSLAKLQKELAEAWKSKGYKIPSLRTLYRWSIELNWQARIKEREQKEKELLKKETDEALKDIVRTRTDYLKTLDWLAERIENLIDEVNGLKLEIKSVYDFAQLVNAYDKIVRLRLLLEGVEPEDKEVKIIIEEVKAPKRTETA